ncbi:MAG: class I SAM-dependent methyltransferase [Myxococcales bacterium]
MNFVTPGELDSTARLQRSIYSQPSHRYASDGREDKVDFIRTFVERMVRGRVKAKDDLIAAALRRLPLTPHSRLLDVGCNDGRYLFSATQIHGCTGMGIDLSEIAIRQALESRSPTSRTTFHVAQAERLPVKSASVNCVISFDVFEHLGLPGFKKTMKECRRVLAPRGWLLAYVVSRKDEFTLHHTLRQVTGGRLGVDDQDGHVYENFIHPDVFRAVAAEVGLDLKTIRPYTHFGHSSPNTISTIRFPAGAIRCSSSWTFH